MATNFYEVGSEKLIFSSVSKTITLERGYSQIKTHIDAMLLEVGLVT